MDLGVGLCQILSYALFQCLLSVPLEAWTIEVTFELI